MSALTVQMSRFAAVGLASTATHVVAALAVHELLGMAPLLANLVGFAAAWIVSYAGNHGWTFEGTTTHLWSAPRFAIVSISGLAINQLTVFVMTDLIGTDFAWALLVVVLVVPALSFLLSRIWAFRADADDTPRGARTGTPV